MLDQSIKDLQKSIQWAKQEEDIDILHLARERMTQLEALINKLSNDQQQQQAYADVDDMLPMEWPLWMEACRYGDDKDDKEDGDEDSK